MEEVVGCVGSGLVSLRSRDMLSFVITGNWLPWQGRGAVCPKSARAQDVKVSELQKM